MSAELRAISRMCARREEEKEAEEEVRGRAVLKEIKRRHRHCGARR
jgi:hypothetical protein